MKLPSEGGRDNSWQEVVADSILSYTEASTGIMTVVNKKPRWRDLQLGSMGAKQDDGEWNNAGGGEKNTQGDTGREKWRLAFTSYAHPETIHGIKWRN